MPLTEILQSVPAGGAWLPIADAILKASLLFALAGLASVALRRASAAARHLVWTLALISALVLPALSLALPRWQLAIVTVATDTPPRAVAGGDSEIAPAAPAPALSRSAVIERTPVASSTSVTPSAAPKAESWLPSVSWPASLLLIWAAGALVLLGRLALGFIAVQWMARRTQRVADAPWLPLARSLADQLGITPRILFLRSGRAVMPMAWGVLLPSVVMPADADTWPAERLRIVLLHELAHVKRRDCLTHMLAQVACALYWFNPLAWMAARHVRTERERACDDLVLAAGTRGPDYADQLLEIARVMRAGRYPGVLAGASLAMANRSQLEGRLMAILDPTVPRAGVTRLRTIGATAVFALALMPLASMQPWAYAATPGAVVARGDGALTEFGPQNPTPTPMPMPTPTPTPMPTPTPTVDSQGFEPVVADAVRGAIQGSLQGAVQGAIQGALQGDVQGAIQGALAGLNVNPDIDVNPNFNYNINTNSNDNINPGQGDRKAADPKAIAALTGALKDADKDVREAALNALVQLRHPGIFDPLVQALSDESPDVREKAAFGLGQMRDARAIGPLTTALKDTSADVREQAVFALGQLRDRSVVPALTAALQDGDDDVREQAVFALGQLRDAAAFDAIASVLRDAKPDVREQAVFALGQLRDRRAVEPLISALKDPAADVREQAAFALGQLRDPAAVEPLVVALKDAAADVREQAAFALGQMRDPRAIDALTDALKDASADVRQQAAFALGQIAR